MLSIPLLNGALLLIVRRDIILARFRLLRDLYRVAHDLRTRIGLFRSKKSMTRSLPRFKIGVSSPCLGVRAGQLLRLTCEKLPHLSDDGRHR